MLLDQDADVSETDTHKIPIAPPRAPQPTTGYLSVTDPAWDLLRSGCEFHLLRYAQTPLLSVPLTDPTAIVDLGCGNGRWATACQAQFPRATVTGLDGKTPHPLTAGEPLGFQFWQADLLHPLPFNDATFDYVHVRFMGMAISIKRWLPLLRESLRVLKPQGWLEVQDLGLPHISHATPWVWLVLLGRAHGVELFPGTALDRWLAQVGGKNVASKELRVQRSADPNASARMMIRDGIAVIEMCRAAILAEQITTPTHYEHELRVMQHNLFVPNRQDTLPIYTAVCQKAGGEG